MVFACLTTLFALLWKEASINSDMKEQIGPTNGITLGVRFRIVNAFELASTVLGLYNIRFVLLNQIQVSLEQFRKSKKSL